MVLCIYRNLAPLIGDLGCVACPEKKWAEHFPNIAERPVFTENVRGIGGPSDVEVLGETCSNRFSDSMD